MFVLIAVALGIWLRLEIGVRQRQQQVGVQVADPDGEVYRIEWQEGDGWEEVGQARFGSFLLREGGAYRVWAESKNRDPARLLGEE